MCRLLVGRILFTFLGCIFAALAGVMEFMEATAKSEESEGFRKWAEDLLNEVGKRKFVELPFIFVGYVKIFVEGLRKRFAEELVGGSIAPSICFALLIVPPTITWLSQGKVFKATLGFLAFLSLTVGFAARRHVLHEGLLKHRSILAVFSWLLTICFAVYFLSIQNLLFGVYFVSNLLIMLVNGNALRIRKALGLESPLESWAKSNLPKDENSKRKQEAKPVDFYFRYLTDREKLLFASLLAVSIVLSPFPTIASFYAYPTYSEWSEQSFLVVAICLLLASPWMGILSANWLILAWYTGWVRPVYFSYFGDVRANLSSFLTSLGLGVSVTCFAIWVGQACNSVHRSAYPLQLFTVNAFCDGLTIFFTWKIFERVMVGGTRSLGKLFLVGVADLVIASALAFCSLILGLRDTADAQGVTQLGHTFLGRSLDGKRWEFGPFFWVMHTTFIPILFFSVCLFVLITVRIGLVSPMNLILSRLSGSSNPYKATKGLVTILASGFGAIAAVFWFGVGK